MKKISYIILLLILILLIFLSGCGRAEAGKNLNSKDSAKKIKVYASIYPMYDFAEKIGKDRIELRQMVPQGAEPHGWEPTAKLMAELSKADLLIFNGAGMEPWAEKLKKSLSSEKIIVIDASEGIELLKLGKDDEHENGHEIYDPHIWLDPLNAMLQAENIKNALIKCDEENKEFYENNYVEFAKKLISLDKKYKEELGKRKRNEIVVAHGAFGYLAKRYGLEQISIKGAFSEGEPDPSKMSEITKLLKSKEIKYVFFESLTNPKLSEVLAKEVGANTEVLDPIDGLKDPDGTKDYLFLMGKNLSALKKALGE